MLKSCKIAYPNFFDFLILSEWSITLGVDSDGESDNL